MNKVVFLTAIVSFLFLDVNAQNSKCQNQLLCPIGFTKDRFLEGRINPYLEYRKPEFNISVPQSLEFQEKLPYEKLLQSGLNSLLLEYKNYYGTVKSSSYLLFGLGNFNSFDQEILDFLNQKVFSNQKVLLSIFDWIRPYYEKIFNELTVEEQNLMYSKLQQAEKYVEFVLIEKNEEKFNQWLSSNSIEKDEKLLGFFNRRISKKQWSVNDCMFWIKKVKSAFPSIKDEKVLASHYQIIQTIENGLQIVCNHVGNYFIVANQGNQPLSKGFKYVSYDDNDRCFLLFEKQNSEFTTKYFLNENGILELPQDPSWRNWMKLTNVLYFIEKENEDGQLKKEVINIQNQKILYSDFKILQSKANGKYFEIVQNDNSVTVINKDGVVINNQPIIVDLVPVVMENFEIIDFYQPKIQYSNDGKFLIIENSKSKFGMIDENGQEVLPFKYEQILFSDDGKFLKVWKNIKSTYREYSIEQKRFMPSK